MEETTEIWNRVNSLIKARNTTQAALSVDCGFNSRRIQNLSGANRLPDAIEITKIAKSLGTTVEYLVTGCEPDTARNQLKDIKAQLTALANSISIV